VVVPAHSVIGSVTATAFVPALGFDTTSDQGYIFKLSNNSVGVWVHVSHPQPAGIAADGVITTGSAPFGPVITWDFTQIADGAQAGVADRSRSAVRLDGLLDRQLAVPQPDDIQRPDNGNRRCENRVRQGVSRYRSTMPAW
jgi:hypothetical protein